MRTLLAIVMTVGLSAAIGSAQTPTITQISNAASQFSNTATANQLPGGAIAQGAFFAIYGTNLGASPGMTWPGTYPLPTTTNGTSVSVGGVPAWVEYAGPGQVNAIMPSKVPAGPASVTVKTSSGTSAAFTVNVVATTVGTFAANYAGSGPGVITDANYKPFTLAHTAKPGDTVILWATGMGPQPDAANEGMSGACPTGCNFLSSGYSVTVWVGGKAVTPAYAGRSPGETAVDQINFTVPTDSVTGCYVPVTVVAGPTGSAQVVGNFTSMTIDSSGTTCSDADGINYADISAAVASKGSANVGAISLLSNYLPLNIFPPSPPLQFDNDTVNGEIGTFSANVLNDFQSFTISPSVGTCTTGQFIEFPPPSDPELLGVTYLDAGADLTISGGQGPNPTQMVPKNSNGRGYGALVGGASIANLISGNGLAPYFLTSTSSNGQFTPTGIAASTYTVTGPGGSKVGAFSGSLQITSAAASFKWTNMPSSAIDRSKPLTITWSGGDPNGFVDITAIASATKQSLLPLATDPGIFMECIVPTAPGSFTIPTYVLQSLPSTASSTSPVAGELLVGPASGAQKVSPTPTGLDALYLFYHFIAGIGIGWK